MALSVLVALMMLAVPLASSSNLFVDGGQTNSNGDAPTLGADAVKGTYILYFDYAAPANSLDEVVLDDSLKAGTVTKTVNNVNNSVEFSLVKGETTQDNRILAYVKQNDAGEVTIGGVIEALETLITGRDGYILVSWNDANNKSYSSNDKQPVSENMTLTAKWELDSVTLSNGTAYDFKEFNVSVNVTDEEPKSYVKAYLVTEDEDGNPIIEFNVKLTPANGSEKTYNKVIGDSADGVSVSDVDSKGFIITNYAMDKTDETYSDHLKSVYNITTSDTNKKVIYDSTGKITDKDLSKIVSGEPNNSFVVNYDLTSTYTKIEISSTALKNTELKDYLVDGKVVVFAYKGNSFTYNDLLDYLTKIKVDSNNTFITVSGDVDPATGELKAFDGKYVLTGWDEKSAMLNDTSKVTTTNLTLDARTNSYNVIFMVDGEYEVIEVPFGTELSADMTKLYSADIDHWVTTSDFKSFTSFRFTADEITKAEGNESFILIACFQPANKTAYAVFNANTDNASGTATFGNDLVKTIVIPGEINTQIAKVPANPVKEGKNLFMGWKTSDYTLKDGVYAYDTGASNPTIDYNSAQKYNVKDKVSTYTTDIQTYKWTISFSVDGSVIGILYYKGSNTISMAGSNGLSNELVNTNLIAYQCDGKVYAKGDTTQAGKTALANIIDPLKAGYSLSKWVDADGKAVIDDVNTYTSYKDGRKVDSREYSSADLKISELKGNLTLSAEFEAKEFIILYRNTFDNLTANQTAKVDEEITLFGGNIFLHDGYEVKIWNDRQDGGGKDYALSSKFTLTGEQYEELFKDPMNIKLNEDGHYIYADVPVLSLYSVWEKLGSGSGTGGNTGGDNDNTALYLIAGMLAVIAILAIVGILLMRRK